MSVQTQETLGIEGLFRAVNDRIRHAEQGWQQKQVEFLCECADGTCFDAVTLTLRDYDDLRSCPRYFVVCHGHVVADAERVVAENGGFVVVQKGQDEH